MRLRANPRHRISPPLRAALLATAIALLEIESAASADLGGRFFLTYQTLREPTNTTERLAQHFETIFRDQVGRNRLALGFFFDNNSNLSRDLTLRRYRLQFDAIHPHYIFNAQLVPRQKTTALELEQSRELAANQVSLDLRVPAFPQLRLVYSVRDDYQIEELRGETRDLRGDLRYRVNIFEFRLNRWYTKSKNSMVKVTNISGGGVRVGRNLGPAVAVSSTYDFQLNQTERGLDQTDVKSHDFSAYLSGVYRHWVAGMVSYFTRRLTTDSGTPTRSRNDNFLTKVSMFPKSPVSFTVMRTYLLNDSQTKRMLADYATLELRLRGNLGRHTTGQLQATSQHDLDSENGIVPPSLLYLTGRSKIRDGIDVRADVSLSRRNDNGPNVHRYQAVSLLELVLMPMSSWVLTPTAQSVASNGAVSKLVNERYTLGLRATYFAPRRWTFGFDWNVSRMMRINPRWDQAIAFNMNVLLRGRTTFSASYGINTSEIESDGLSVPEEKRTGSKTLNVRGQVWLSHKGSLSVSWNRIEWLRNGVSNDVGLTYRLDF